jgi:peptidoglycan/LPS O-acetylase OafA/YrhL
MNKQPRSVVTTASASPPLGATGRIHELDALRGIAAIGVVLWHYGAHFHARPLDAVLHPFYNAGFLLVDFFFVLSGYVIARAYWRPSRQFHPAANIWARIARLYPLHLFTLLATVLILAALPAGANDPDFQQPTNNLKHLLLNLTLLNQSGLQDGWSFNTPAWSISTEFIVNVAFLAFIALDNKVRTVAVILAVIGIGALAMFQPAISGERIFGYLDLNLARCFLGFGAGLLVYWLVHRLCVGERIARHPRSANALAIASGLATVGLLLGSGRHPPAWHYVVSIIAAIGCVTFVPFARIARRFLRARYLVFLGDISYSTYLTHYPLQLGLYCLAQYYPLQLDYRSPLVLALYMGLVIAISTLTQRWIEVPAQRGMLDYASRGKAGVMDSG